MLLGPGSQRPPRAPGRVRPGRAQRRGRGEGQGGDEDQTTPGTSNPTPRRKVRPTRERGLFQDLQGLLTDGPEHMGLPQRTSPSEGNFPRGPPFNPVRPGGCEADPCAGSPTPLPRGHLTAPTTAHPYPPRAQAWLRSGRHTGDRRGAAEVPGAVTPGLSPARTPVRLRGAGAGRTFSPGAPLPRPGPLPGRGGGRVWLSGRRCPLRPRRLPGIVLSTTSIPLHAPPTPRPPGRVARPRPAGPAAMNM